MLASQTQCGTTEGCSVTPTTTTTTISTTGTVSTMTNRFMYISEPVEPSSVLASLSSSIVSQQSAWDATRWEGVVATPTPTAPSAIYHIYWNESQLDAGGRGYFVDIGVSYDNCTITPQWVDGNTLTTYQIGVNAMPDFVKNLIVGDALCNYTAIVTETVDSEHNGTAGTTLGRLDCDLYTEATCYLPANYDWTCTENIQAGFGMEYGTEMVVCDWDGDSLP
jgi:hypothetical protein